VIHASTVTEQLHAWNGTQEKKMEREQEDALRIHGL
jgi:hypothetical protein